MFLVTSPSFSHGGGAGIEWEILSEQAVKLLNEGRYDEGVTVAQKALKIAERKVGRNHPHVATGLNNLAELYYARGENASAGKLLERSLVIREKALGPASEDFSRSDPTQACRVQHTVGGTLQ